MKTESSSPDVRARESLKLLVEGNRRFSEGVRSIESFTSSLRLKEFAEKGQRPFAIIVTCSDSRIPAEILFDRGVGDLFVVRVAGNVAESGVIASVEFAAMSLGIPLCVVMGHTGCGAVQAALEWRRTRRSAGSPHLDALVSRIVPTLGETTEVDQAVLGNLRNTVAMLQSESAPIRSLVEDRKLTVVGAVYQLSTGVVTFD